MPAPLYGADDPRRCSGNSVSEVLDKLDVYKRQTYHSTTTGHFHLLANTHRPQLKNNMSTLFFLMFRLGCCLLYTSIFVALGFVGNGVITVMINSP